MSSKAKRRAKAKPKAETRKPRTRAAVKKAAPTRPRPPKVEPIPAAKAPIPRPPAKTFFAVVRLQGPIAVPENMEDTLRALRLHRRFNATIVEKNETSSGLLQMVKDYVTWGEISADQIASLLQERGETNGGGGITDEFVKAQFDRGSVHELALALTTGQIELRTLWQKGIRPVLRLRPPSGGFDASVKRSFATRGEVGYRGSEITGLVSRMT